MVLVVNKFIRYCIIIIIIIIIYAQREGHYEMMGGVCLSVVCLDHTRERKSLRSS